MYGHPTNKERGLNGVPGDSRTRDMSPNINEEISYRKDDQRFEGTFVSYQYHRNGSVRGH